MAQERARRTGGTARRLGLKGRMGAALALVVVLVGACVVAAASGGGGAVTVERASTPDPAPSSPAPDPEPVPETLFVHVDGAVASPGVYELAEGSRVVDGITAAGGLAEGADTTALNLAARVEDGEKIHVPVAGEMAPAGDAAGVAGTADTTGAPSLVNLNTATAAELCTLPGVGEATAEAIVRDREANGPFSSVDDLMRVSGIGAKKFAKLEGRIRV